MSLARIRATVHVIVIVRGTFQLRIILETANLLHIRYDLLLRKSAENNVKLFKNLTTIKFLPRFKNTTYS